MMWLGVTAGSPESKGIPDAKKEEDRGTSCFPKGWSVRVLMTITIYPEGKKSKQGNWLVGKLGKLGTVGPVTNYLILAV